MTRIRVRKCTPREQARTRLPEKYRNEPCVVAEAVTPGGRVVASACHLACFARLAVEELHRLANRRG